MRAEFGASRTLICLELADPSQIFASVFPMNHVGPCGHIISAGRHFASTWRLESPVFHHGAAFCGLIGILDGLDGRHVSRGRCLCVLTNTLLPMGLLSNSSPTQNPIHWPHLFWGSCHAPRETAEVLMRRGPMAQEPSGRKEQATTGGRGKPPIPGVARFGNESVETEKRCHCWLD